ncbi:MAG: aldehyde dehydrogenase [Epulopiscium sp.]|nr:aldehyde dehydrogenase [Candidatus Epulonipiscium sp.]
MNNISNIVKSQQDFFKSNTSKNIDFRIYQLKSLARTIIKYEEQIIDALYKDFKKPAFESYTTELYTVLSEIKYFIKNLPKLSKSKKASTSFINFPSKGYITPEPYGVCLIISPWNYPIQLTLSPLVGAIATGNCVIIKPSEHSPNTSNILETIINEAFPPHYISLLKGDESVAKELLNQDIDYIFFTGSQRVGKKVMTKAADNLIPITLELGGKSPVIVDRDANIPVTARRIVWGKFINCGQTCVAPDYILAHEDIKDELLHYICKYIIKFYSKTPEHSPDYARIISADHFDRLKAYIQEDKIFFGGKTNKKDLFISPTVLHNIKPTDPIMQDEIFGPLLPIITFSKLNHAIKIVENNPKPLALYYFGNNKERENLIISSISFGGGCVNDTIMHLSSNHLPFGGVGYSGIGSYHGKASFHTFSHYKSILNKSAIIDTPFRYPPYKGKLKLVRGFTIWQNPRP